MGITALNAYSGQAGFYILEDAALEASLDLPRGSYDIPLMLNSKRYTSTGNITNESAETISTYGDTPSVNGQILPHFVVEPRKYRFRVLNAAASRTFNLTLNVDATRENKKFHVVGSDSGFMSKSVETESLVVAMAERWEVCISTPGRYMGHHSLFHTILTRHVDRNRFCKPRGTKHDVEAEQLLY